MLFDNAHGCSVWAGLVCGVEQWGRGGEGGGAATSMYVCTPWDATPRHNRCGHIVASLAEGAARHTHSHSATTPRLAPTICQPHSPVPPMVTSSRAPQLWPSHGVGGI